MTTRLFCKHCDKFYEVDIKDIRFMQEHMSEDLSFSHNTYFFNDGCFFKKLNTFKKRFIPT